MDALESVLDDLRQLAREHPAITSALLRALRSIRDLVESAAADFDKKATP